MECRVCGRHIQNENANFCEYCGESLRSVNNQQEFRYHQPSSMFSHNENAVETPNEKPVSFGNWLGSMMILLIPIPAIGIFMLLRWAFGNNVPISKKNWAKAQLIVTLFVMIIVLWVLSSNEFKDVFNTLYQ